jgi:hypothetical protein
VAPVGRPGDAAALPLRRAPDPPKPGATVARHASAGPARTTAGTGRRQLRVAVALGLAVALAIVAAAVVLRPAPAATGPAAPTALGSGPLPAARTADEAAPPSTPVAASRVWLRHGPDLPAARLASLAAAIEAAGYGGLELAPMPFPIDRPRVEFFHPADRAAAEALGRTLAALTGAPLDVRDLGEATLGAEPGRLDLWIDR